METERKDDLKQVLEKINEFIKILNDTKEVLATLMTYGSVDQRCGMLIMNIYEQSQKLEEELPKKDYEEFAEKRWIYDPLKGDERNAYHDVSKQIENYELYISENEGLFSDDPEKWEKIMKEHRPNFTANQVLLICREYTRINFEHGEKILAEIPAIGKAKKNLEILDSKAEKLKSDLYSRKQWIYEFNYFKEKFTCLIRDLYDPYIQDKCNSFSKINGHTYKESYAATFYSTIGGIKTGLVRTLKELELLKSYLSV